MNVEFSTKTTGAYTSYSPNVSTSSTSKEDAATSQETKKNEDKSQDVGAVYEMSEEAAKSSGNINKMSEVDRKELVSKLKSEMEKNKTQLMNIVQKTLTGQVTAYGQATGDDIWKRIAGGGYTVDAATKAQAKKDISEDGYWGVKQTSQRLYDFASALAGDDVENMKKMQKAMQKGFKLATGAWGGDMPSITSQTLDAANKLFDDYYASKGVQSDK